MTAESLLVERITEAWREYLAVAEETARSERALSRLSRSVSTVVGEVTQAEWEHVYGKER
ncbi:hypothetical protein [Actinopolyspora mortivallis]|uniref:Uncharacterized protein n=1 Tax=Actinopolyspora mortivallis TaxID=33906 RepID=A0A2T0GSH4_ACTMO|nr:hypothetical protein [Actinopolyspora mortivallis]PRW61993.1 hypothetical protein CEP50_17780 [Actinopolyspora mortivallis]